MSLLNVSLDFVIKLYFYFKNSISNTFIVHPIQSFEFFKRLLYEI